MAEVERAQSRRMRSVRDQEMGHEDEFDDDEYDTTFDDGLYSNPQSGGYDRVNGGAHSNGAIRNQKVGRGGWYVGSARALVSILLFFVLGWVFLGLSIGDVYNTRIDYNTDFSDRSCGEKCAAVACSVAAFVADPDICSVTPLDGGAAELYGANPGKWGCLFTPGGNTINNGDSCQERNLQRVHAIELTWLLSPIYIAIGFMYFWTLTQLYTLNLYGMHADTLQGDGAAWLKRIKATLSKSGVNAFIASAAMVEQERANGFPIHHNITHLLFDTVVFPMFLTTLGVRDFWKLMFFGAFCCSTNLLLWYINSRNRSPSKLGKKASILTERQTAIGTVRWQPLLWWFACNAFIFSVFLLYLVKFPHKSRTWYIYLTHITVMTYLALHTLYHLGFYALHDLRVGGGKKADGFGLLSKMVSIPSTAFPMSGGLVGMLNGIILVVIYLVAGVPFLIGAAFYIIARFAGMIYRTVDDGAPGAMTLGLNGRNFFDAIFIAFDALLAVLPLILLAGLHGHANVSQIVFPDVQTMVF